MIEDEKAFWQDLALSLLDQHGDATRIIGMDKKILAVNQEYANLLQKEIQELIGQDCNFHFCPLDQYDFPCALEEVKKGQCRVHHLFPAIEKNGHSAFDYWASPVMNSNGQAWCVIERFRNISVAHLNQRLMDRFMKNSPDFFYRLFNQVPVFLSPAFERITGYKAEELIDGSFAWNNLLLKEDIVKLDFAMARAALGELYEVEYRVRHRNGFLIWLRDRAVNIESQGNAGKVIEGIISEITERKNSEIQIRESEKKFRDLFELSNDAILILDQQARVIEMNTKVSELFLLSKEDMRHASVLNLFQGFNQDKMNDIINQTFAGENVRAELQGKDHKGTLLDIEVSTSLFDHKERRIQMVLRDVSERKQIRNRLLKTIIETQEVERKRFAEDLHDELGPFLSGIQLYINELAHEDFKPDQRRQLVQYLEEMVDEAINKTRTISNNLMPSVLVDYGIFKALYSFIYRINETGRLDIFLNFDDEQKRYHATVEIVAYRIVIELVNNTIKYAEASEVRLDIVEEDGFLRIDYKDDGIGFDLDQAIEQKNGSGINNIMNRISSLNGHLLFHEQAPPGIHLTIKIPLGDSSK